VFKEFVEVTVEEVVVEDEEVFVEGSLEGGFSINEKETDFSTEGLFLALLTSISTPSSSSMLRFFVEF
jgi:hypothetical protein